MSSSLQRTSSNWIRRLDAVQHSADADHHFAVLGISAVAFFGDSVVVEVLEEPKEQASVQRNSKDGSQGGRECHGSVEKQVPAVGPNFVSRNRRRGGLQRHCDFMDYEEPAVHAGLGSVADF